MLRLLGAVLKDDHNDWSTRRLFDMVEYYSKVIEIKKQWEVA